MARLILDVVLAPFLLKTATPAGNVSDSKGASLICQEGHINYFCKRRFDLLSAKGG